MNNDATIVGTNLKKRGGQVPVVWKNGVLEELPTWAADFQGSSSGSALGVNDAGTVVGYSYLTPYNTSLSSEFRAWIWKEGKQTDLNDYLEPEVRAAGWTLSIASGVSRDGRIIGQATNSSLYGQAIFVLTPVTGLPTRANAARAKAPTREAAASRRQGG